MWPWSGSTIEIDFHCVCLPLQPSLCAVWASYRDIVVPLKRSLVMLEDCTPPCGGMSRMRCGSGDSSVVFMCTMCRSQHNSVHSSFEWKYKAKNSQVCSFPSINALRHICGYSTFIQLLSNSVLPITAWTFTSSYPPWDLEHIYMDKVLLQIATNSFVRYWCFMVIIMETWLHWQHQYWPDHKQRWEFTFAGNLQTCRVVS